MKIKLYTSLFFVLFSFSAAQDSTITIQGAILNLNNEQIWSMFIPALCHDFDVSFTDENGEIVSGEIVPCGYEGELCYQLELDVTVSNDPVSISPNRFNISQNYPNPFNPVTSLQASIPNEGRFEIYDILGREVQSASFSHAGDYEISWGGMNKDGKASPSGVYLYRLTDGKTMRSGKMTLLDGGSTSGLSVKPIGYANPSNKQKRTQYRSISGSIELTASCITDLSIPVTVSTDTTIHLLCNLPPIGEDETITTHIKQRMTQDLNDLFDLDSPAFYEIDTVDQCTIVEDHFLQYIPLEGDTASVELIAIDSLDTTLRDTILITTEAIDWDTTSQLFTYVIDTVGFHHSKIIALDVIDENTILYGGQIRTDEWDSLVWVPYTDYSLAWWDGEEYELFRYTMYPLNARSIKYFNEDDIWVTSQCLPYHWDGNEWVQYHLPNMGLDVCVGEASWGTSSDNMYFVGDYGIVHYDGIEFRDVGNGIDVPLTDIDGTPDGKHLFARGYDNYVPSRNIILEYHGAEWDTLYYIEDHYWPEEDDYGHLEGIGVFGDTLYVVTVAGFWKYNFIDSTSILIPDSVLPLCEIHIKDIHIITPYDILFHAGAFRTVHYNGNYYYENREIYDQFAPTPTYKSYYDGEFGVVVGALTPEWMGLVVRWYHE